jgi:hypothetical protein
MNVKLLPHGKIDNNGQWKPISELKEFDGFILLKSEYYNGIVLIEAKNIKKFSAAEEWME